MLEDGKQQVLRIKKYPNRRFYDATRSRHVTLQQVFEAVRAGDVVVITDSRTSEDITNLVLTHIILEKDEPKLDLLPAWVFHQLIRANRHVLRSSVDRFFGPFMQVLQVSQKQFESYRREVGDESPSSLDRANSTMPAPAPIEGPGSQPAESPPLAPLAERPAARQPYTPPDTLAQLREEVAELTRQIEALTARQNQEEPGSPNKS